jgi:hypothetical protein
LKNGWDFGSGGGASGMKVKLRKSDYFSNNNTRDGSGIAMFVTDVRPAFQVPWSRRRRREKKSRIQTRGRRQQNCFTLMEEHQ